MGNFHSNRPVVLCMTGIDGSGKTTQARLLVEFLNGRGIKSKYVWNRYEPWAFRPIMWIGRLLTLRGQDMFKDYANYSDKKRAVFKNNVIARIFEYCYIMEYILQSFIRVVVPLLMGTSIVCDRYVYDAVVSLAIDLRYPESKVDRVLQLFLRILPEPEAVFLLDLAEEVAFERKTDVPDISYLRERRRLYTAISKIHDIKSIDSCMAKEEVAAAIQSHMLGVIRRIA